MGIHAAIARGRQAERKDALSSEARAFLLFCQIAERDGLEEAQQIYARIVRVTRDRINRKRPPRKKGKGVRSLNNLFNVRMQSIWMVWKSQNPQGTEEEFGRWFEESPL